MHRYSLTLEDAQQMGLDVSWERFMGGTFAYCWERRTSGSGQIQPAIGSAFYKDSATAISKAVGELLERRISHHICSSRGWDLGKASNGGWLGASFHFSVPGATKRAVAELWSRRVKANVWRGSFGAYSSDAFGGAREQLQNLTGRKFVILKTESDPNWMGILSGEGRSAGVLFSDGYFNTEPSRFFHAVCEHLMFLAALASPYCTAAPIQFCLDDVVAALTSGGCARHPGSSAADLIVRPAHRFGFVAVATPQGWTRNCDPARNDQLGALPF